MTCVIWTMSFPGGYDGGVVGNPHRLAAMEHSPKKPHRQGKELAMRQNGFTIAASGHCGLTGKDEIVPPGQDCAHGCHKIQKSVRP
ncbi:MAG: hypothetical protein M0Z52_12535 [Actinomycetota bacterium]|nr:hypothetical protein [Actinomycetota bacterium]